jgi:hypothetical protein
MFNFDLGIAEAGVVFIRFSFGQGLLLTVFTVGHRTPLYVRNIQEKK